MRPLPMAEARPDDGACCAACAARQATPVSATNPAPIIRRADDRRVTLAGVLLAACLLGAALLVAVVTVFRGSANAWPVIHLALAGAASTAVVAVLPFFTAALARVAPAPTAVRAGAILLVAGGALAVTTGVTAGLAPVAVLGGLSFLGGLAFAAFAAFAPLSSAIGVQRRPVPIAYAAALLDVAIGAALATAMLAGREPVVGAWAAIKPAHAWLNVFGFLSVVIAATLIHLAPTVVGARIRPRRSATIALAGMVIGAPLVAIGFGFGSDALARAGALVELIGALALAVHGLVVWRDRASWTSDPGWHRVTSLSLLAAPGWFLLATIVATARILSFGASPMAWSMTAIGVPLVLGWVTQVLVGAWTHLVPAIGPGDPVAHAEQRRRLGRAAAARLVGLNAGVTALWIGSTGGLQVIAGLGALLIGGSLVGALALLVTALPVRHGRGNLVAARRT